MSACTGSGGVTMTSNTYDRLIPLVPPQLPADTSPWFAGKMERGQAEQFLMDVSWLGRSVACMKGKGGEEGRGKVRWGGGEREKLSNAHGRSSVLAKCRCMARQRMGEEDEVSNIL